LRSAKKGNLPPDQKTREMERVSWGKKRVELFQGGKVRNPIVKTKGAEERASHPQGKKKKVSSRINQSGGGEEKSPVNSSELVPRGGEGWERFEPPTERDGPKKTQGKFPAWLAKGRRGSEGRRGGGGWKQPHTKGKTLTGKIQKRLSKRGGVHLHKKEEAKLYESASWVFNNVFVKEKEDVSLGKWTASWGQCDEELLRG